MIYQLGDKVRIQQKHLDRELCHPEWKAAGVGTILRFPTMLDSLAFSLLYSLAPDFIVQFEGIGHPIPVVKDMVELAGEREGYPLRFTINDVVQAARSFCPCEQCDFTVGTVTDVITSFGGANPSGDYEIMWDGGSGPLPYYDRELVPGGHRLEEL